MIAPAQADTPPVYPNTQAEIGASQDWLSAGRGAWSDRWMQMKRTLAQRELYYVRIGSSQRFGQFDTYYGAGAYVPLGSRAIGSIEATFSPTHTILPQSDVAASVEERLPHGWGLAPGYEERAYTAVHAQVLSLMVDRYAGNDRFAYRLTRSTLSSGEAAAFTHAFTYTHYFGAYSSSSLTAAVFFGRDVETAQSGVVLAGTRGASLSWTQWISSRWSLSCTLQSQQLDGLYARTGLSLALRNRF